ncbi:alpha/beta fold hydrolase [Amycolatopsis sp. GM8]|uniref:alpha/beta fold hydrolase n=1 Tax=Amycolatopsis sp. GM8 TaxID=2896530 RepID=UPI001F1D54E4|nr:alpha/beta fold hydrolase [Amycolatopsis sp. GM8]
MAEILNVNGVELAVETFGERRDPAILLIGGGAAAMDWWDADLCRRLAAGMRFVIRYDSRDTGQSVHYPPGKPGYGFPDLAADALGILDAFGVARAHVAGISMGGTVAQQLAVHHPDRLLSLTLLSTTAGGPGLPSMSAEVTEFFATATQPDWADDAAVVEYLVDAERHFETPEYFDEDQVRALAGQVVARSKNFASAQNHAFLEGGEPVRDRLGEIELPTLIIHGTADPMFPYGHAEALARAIPGAELLPLNGVGHQLPPRSWWDTVVPAVLRHTSGGWDAQADRLAARSLENGDPTGWFDRLYSAGVAGEVPMPWDRATATPPLVDWAGERTFEPGRAVVVGCGLGADAEFLARLGFTTTAFDISPTAVDTARGRHPGSTVDYRVADLLDPPTEFIGAFDLVAEIFTVQAMPRTHRAVATANVRRLVAPGGTLLVIASRGDGDESGPPWPPTREEIEAFAGDGLAVVRIEQSDRWRAEFRRQASAGTPK